MVTPSKKRHPFRAKLVHALRVCLVISLLLAIPSPAKPTNGDAANPPNLDQVNFQFDAFGNGIENESLFLDPKSDVNGMWRLRNDDNKTVGLVARTLPIAKDIVGYRGPTEAVIVLNP